MLIGQITSEEATQKGAIACNTYLSYISAAGGLIVSALLMLWFIVQAVTIEFSQYWLSHWLSQGDGVSTNSLCHN